MFGFDFSFFWRASNAVLQGQSPYVVGGFMSPYPLAVLLVPLALLPFALAYGLWTGLKLLLLARSGNRRGFLMALLFFPVAFDLLQGQLDLMVFIIAAGSNWIGLVISTLRPQLAIWIIPFCAYEWWKHKRYDQFWKSALGVVVLYGTSTLITPNWWLQWFNALDVAWQYNEQSASLFGLTRILPYSHISVFIGISMLAVATFILLRPQTPRTFWQFVAMFNPIANVYSLVVLYNQADWVVVVLALLALPLSLASGTNAVWTMIPLYLVLKDRFIPAPAGHFAAVPEPHFKEG
jgi:hypothetical protein